MHRGCNAFDALTVRTPISPGSRFLKVEANDSCVAISGTDEDGDDFRKVCHIDPRIYNGSAVTAEMENGHWLRLTIPKHDDPARMSPPDEDDPRLK